MKASKVRELILNQSDPCCCVCGRGLGLDKKTHIHCMLIHVPWETPTWKGGSVDGFTDHLAYSIVCNSCQKERDASENHVSLKDYRINAVIEFLNYQPDSDDFILKYHLITWLPNGQAILEEINK